MKHHFPLVFSPFRLKNLTVKNRVVMAPIDTNLADEDGCVTEDLLAFYEKRARGGVGLLIVENSQVDFPLGKNTKRQLSLHKDAMVKGLSKLSQLIRNEGACPAIQLHHAGRETTLEVTEGLRPVAPSPIPCGHLKTPVRELEKSEIVGIIEKFVAAALRAKQAGFDLIEIHGAHGYLVGEFLSPYTNKRRDAYGKDFQGRMRFAIEIIQGIKDALGKEFPLSFRFSADEFVKGGIDVSESQRIACGLERAGVDVLHVSAGIYESLPTLLEPMAYPEGWRCHLAAAVKKTVSIPVIAVGVIREPSFAEQVLEQGKADFVAVGRGLLADPDWSEKAMNGRDSELRRCIGCNIGCLSKRLTHSIQCSLNPETGLERHRRILSLKAKKRLTIVGGGPSGLECARVAALRGFQTTLFEKEEWLGGQMRIASLPPGKEKIQWTIDYYERQMELLDVDLRFGVKIGVKAILETKPDSVVLATGSLPVPCLFNAQVTTADSVLSSATKSLGGKAAIVGGGSIGCETALFLSQKDCRVELFEQLNQIAHDMEPISAWDLRERMKMVGIRTHLQSKVVDIQGRSLWVASKGEKMTFGSFDLIVWAVGREPNIELFEELRHLDTYKGPVHVVGDAKEVGRIHDAIHHAYTTVTMEFGSTL